MRNKQLDGVWIMAGMPTAAVTEMCSTAGGRLVSMDDDVIARVQAEYPWYAKILIPAGTYDGQTEPVQTTAVKMLLLTDASMPEDVIYDLTRTFWENLPELGQAHAVMKTVTPDMAVTDLSGIPLHPGAEKYYPGSGIAEITASLLSPPRAKADVRIGLCRFHFCICQITYSTFIQCTCKKNS